MKPEKQPESCKHSLKRGHKGYCWGCLAVLAKRTAEAIAVKLTKERGTSRALRSEVRRKTIALERLHSLTEPGTYYSEIICDALTPLPKPKKRKARR